MTLSEKEQLFLNMLRSHKDQIYKVCWGFTKNPHDVEDLFQEIMINIWKAIASFRQESALSTWIYRIAVNTCILWQKKEKKSPKALKKDLPDFVEVDTSELKNNDQQIRALRSAIQQLKKLDRSMILLVLEGFSYKEIADITGITVSNVGARISRIKTRIKNLLQQK